MSTMIESLEGRTLLAGHGAGDALIARAAVLDDPAVQATLAAVRQGGAAIEAARQQLGAESADTRPALRDALHDGAARLLAAKQAVLESRGDPQALEAARAQLKAERLAVRADVAAAREAVRADTVEARAAFREAVASLRADLRQLRIDVGNAVATAVQPESDQLRTTVEAIEAKSEVTPEQVQGLTDKVEHVAAGAVAPSQTLVRTLVDNFVAAIQDRDISDAERAQLRDDVRAVLESANISPDDLRAIGDDVREIVRASNITWDDVRAVASDLSALYHAVIQSFRPT